MGNREYQQHELELAVLEMLQTGDVRLGNPLGGLVKQYVERLDLKDPWPHRRLAEVFWELQGRGLIYFSFADNPGSTNGQDPAHWAVMLTRRGLAAANGSLPNPDVPESYLKRFAEGIPDASGLVRSYLKESLDAYTNQLYMASAVMLGVAAEAAFLEMVEAFVTCLPASDSMRLRKYLDSATSQYSLLLDEFRKRFDQHKGDFPKELSDKIDLQMNAVLDLIRRYRNASGHPSDFRISQEECYISLVSFALVARRLYSLKGAVEATPREPSL